MYIQNIYHTKLEVAKVMLLVMRFFFVAYKINTFTGQLLVQQMFIYITHSFVFVKNFQIFALKFVIVLKLFSSKFFKIHV